jgi:hypothetical protein
MTETDLLGNPVGEPEAALRAIYEDLKRVLARDDLPPCARANARVALAALWQVINDLDLAFEQISDYGV